eukprot:5121516-Pyramimonas_sp.AAC.1
MTHTSFADTGAHCEYMSKIRSNSFDPACLGSSSGALASGTPWRRRRRGGWCIMFDWRNDPPTEEVEPKLRRRVRFIDASHFDRSNVPVADNPTSHRVCFGRHKYMT